MSATVQIYGQKQTGLRPPIDQKRGMFGMLLVIATEASLFVCLFASYFFLGNNKNRWQTNQPPKLTDALFLLLILVVSSIVLMVGQRMLKHQRFMAARIAMAFTILLGLGFLALSAFEYMDHWKTLTPDTDVYGSIFYTITTIDAAHVIIGLLMLLFVLFLPRYEPNFEMPHRPYQTVALYWHFVTVIWIFIVIILFLIPNGIVYGV